MVVVSFVHSIRADSVVSMVCDFPSCSRQHLLVVAEENLDRQPCVATDLEALGKRVDLLHLLVGELPAIKLEVALDAGCSDRLGND
jgi:hypothetical protein